MRRPQITLRRARHRRRHSFLGLAALALVACAKTPDPPGECSPIQVTVDWEQFHPIPLQTNLDSLRSLVARTEDAGTRIHLVQEYVLAAHRLDRPARKAALASVAKVLEQARKQ